MDFSGHGKSSHRAKDAEYSLEARVIEVRGSRASGIITNNAVQVFDVADALHWDTFVLMGHSMGAGVATMATGACPERIEKVRAIAVRTHVVHSAAALSWSLWMVLVRGLRLKLLPKCSAQRCAVRDNARARALECVCVSPFS